MSFKQPVLSLTDRQWLENTIGMQCLHVGKKWKSFTECERIIEAHMGKKSKCRLNAKDRKGNTALHLVAISESYPIIGGLLLCGADVNATNNSGKTPITYSEHCSDYNVGFQFFRHLHKLIFIGQYVNEGNYNWYMKTRDIYDKKYPQGYLTAFTHDSSFTVDIISSIIDNGEDTLAKMYKAELEKMKFIKVRTEQTLHDVVDLTNQAHLSKDQLEIVKRCIYNVNERFPLLGSIIKQKYRLSLKYHETKDSDDSTEATSASKLFDTVPRKDINFAQSWSNQVEQGMTLCTPDEASALAAPSEYPMDVKKKDEQDALGTYRFSNVPLYLEDVLKRINSNVDENVDEVTRLLAKVPRPGQES